MFVFVSGLNKTKKDRHICFIYTLSHRNVPNQDLLMSILFWVHYALMPTSLNLLLKSYIPVIAKSIAPISNSRDCAKEPMQSLSTSSGMELSC